MILPQAVVGMAVSAYAEPMAETYPSTPFWSSSRAEIPGESGQPARAHVDFATASHVRAVVFLLLCACCYSCRASSHSAG